MQIDPGGMTKMAGEESQMRLESQFVGLLEKVNRAAVEEGELVLSRGEKDLLRFRATK
jgi:heat shock protein HslJ